MPCLNCISLRLRTPCTTVMIGSLRVPPGIPLLAALEWLDKNGAPAQSDWHRHKAVHVMQDPLPCLLQVADASVRPAPDGSLIKVCTSGNVYCVAKGRPDSHHQLAAVYRHVLGAARCEVACLNLYGDRLHAAELLPAVVAVGSVDVFGVLEPFQLPYGALRDATCIGVAPALEISIPAAYASDWWISFPHELLACLGGVSRFDHFPPQPGQSMSLTLTALSLPLQLTPAALQEWLRRLLVVAVLRQEEAAAKARGEACVLVEVQVVTCTIWHGGIPATFACADLSDLWVHASRLTYCNPHARVYSGPFAQTEATTVGQLESSSHCVHRNRHTGRLVVTFHPEIVGGGNKTEVQAALKSRLAQVCLEKGCALNEVNRAVGQVMQKAALSRLQEVLRGEVVEDQWSRLVDVFQVYGVQMPLGDDAAQRATKRIQVSALHQCCRPLWATSMPLPLSVSVIPALMLRVVEVRCSFRS